eukprot:3518995-Pleurochrysis_carterae.AAC.2
MDTRWNKQEVSKRHGEAGEQPDGRTRAFTSGGRVIHVYKEDCFAAAWELRRWEKPHGYTTAGTVPTIDSKDGVKRDNAPAAAYQKSYSHRTWHAVCSIDQYSL